MDDSTGAHVGVSQIGLVGLAVMGQVGGYCMRPRAHCMQDCQAARHYSLMYMPFCAGRALQNLALNVADKGFSISVFNRTYEKTEAAVRRAGKEGAW